MREALQYRFENDLRATAGNGHAHLFSDAFLASLENVAVWECLEPGSFPIGKGSRFRPVVHVCSTAATTRHGV